MRVPNIKFYSICIEIRERATPSLFQLHQNANLQIRALRNGSSVLEGSGPQQKGRGSSASEGATGRGKDQKTLEADQERPRAPPFFSARQNPR